MVSNQLGHSNVATTANSYAHVLEEAAAEAAEHVAALLAGSRVLGEFWGNAKGPDRPGPCVCAGRSGRGDRI